jgi:hypothetical protein
LAKEKDIMNECPICGFQNPDGAVTCGNCLNNIEFARKRIQERHGTLTSARQTDGGHAVVSPRHIQQNTEQTIQTTDSRKRTLWPYIAAVLSIVAGGVLAIVAYLQINTPDDITKVIGYWNALVTLAYIWLAIRLMIRDEGAYKSGITLSLGNAGFVMAQLGIWGHLTNFTLSGEQLIIAFSFIITDLILFAGIRQCFGDLVAPLLPQNIPNSYFLLQESARTENLGENEIAPFLNMRRDFIAYMHRRLRGSIEINTQRNNQYVDLLVKPFVSYIAVGGNSAIKTYRFHIALDSDQVKDARGLIDYIIALKVPEDVLYEGTKGLMKVSVYSLSDHVRTGGQPSDFDKYAQDVLGFKFKKYKRQKKSW